LTKSLHRLRVSTLDSFFARLATSYTLELGLPPGWTILDDLEDDVLRRQAVEQILSRQETADTRRIAGLIAKGDSGRRVSSLIQDTVGEFYDIYRQTDAAAWQHTPPTGLLTSEALTETIDQLRVAALPSHKSIEKQRDKDCNAAAENDWQSFITSGFGPYVARGETKYYRKEMPAEVCALYQRLLDHARSCLVDQLIRKTAAVHEILTAFDAAYRNLKHRAGGLRFEDVTERLAETLGSGDAPPAGLSHLAYRLDGEISHLLLDEFQDTSLPQWQVLQPFAQQVTRPQENTSFFAVGDTKQAIYGWRGGRAEIFDAIEEQLDGVTSQPLAKSFRSSQVVIDAVNRLFSNLPRHSNLKQDEGTIRQWCAAVESHSTARDLPGHVTLETGPTIPEQRSSEATDDLISLAADRVLQITRSAPQASVGVLVRQNKYIAQLIAQLRARGVDASEESGNPLTDSAPVMLLLSLLQLADHPGDTIARFHVATSPLREALDLAEHDNDNRATQLAAKIRRELVDNGYGPTLDRWARKLIPACTRRDVIRLGQLVDLAYQYQSDASLRPGDFIRFVEQERVQDPSAANVRVMSIHQAKGLQFDTVVLPLLDSQLIAVTPKFVTGGGTATTPPALVSAYANKKLQPLLPADLQAAFVQTQAASIRGELCVLYVAVTRAIHALHMLIPPSKPTEKHLTTNSAGLVRAGLTDGQRAEPSAVLYDHGDPDWPSRVDWSAESATGESAKPGTADSPLQVTLAPMTDGRSRGLGRRAPSQANAGPIRLAELRKVANSAAMDRGTLFHAWFEEVVWLDDGPPGKPLLESIARRLGFQPDQIQQHVTNFLSMLQRDAARRLLSRTSYLSHSEPPLPAAIVDELKSAPCSIEVLREHDVAVRLEGELLTGSIDRLVLIRRGEQVLAADIIDYKTDVISPEGLDSHERTAHYRRQLQAYADAVSTIYELAPERIATRLLFVESDQIVPV